MKAPLKKPCGQCPFRRKSLPGYLGSSSPQEFIAATMNDATMPCHNSVDYAEPNWEDQLAPGGSARHCAGAAILFSNTCKLSMDPDRPKLKADRANVFSNSREFLEHHSSTWKRIFGDKK